MYLSNRNQYVSINEYESGLPVIICGVPQGSVVGLLLFLLYLNDLNQAIKFCKVHHCIHDNNLLCLSYWIKKLNKLANGDLKHLVNWLNTNKISLNVRKTVMVIFKSKQKKLEGDLKIELCGKDYILLKVWNTWVWKLIQILLGSIMLMIFPLNSTELMLSSLVPNGLVPNTWFSLSLDKVL